MTAKWNKVTFWSDESVLKPDSSESYTSLWIYVELHNLKWVNCMVNVSYLKLSGYNF